MIKSIPFVNVRKYIKMQVGGLPKINLKVLFYSLIGVLFLSKAYENFGELGAFFKPQNFSTVDILGYSQQSFALLEIVHYVCSPFPKFNKEVIPCTQ
jgi:hypothetical protein